MTSLEIQKRLDALKPYIITPEADAPDPHYFGGEELDEDEFLDEEEQAENNLKGEGR